MHNNVKVQITAKEEVANKSFAVWGPLRKSAFGNFIPGTAFTVTLCFAVKLVLYFQSAKLAGVPSVLMMLQHWSLGLCISSCCNYTGETHATLFDAPIFAYFFSCHLVCVVVVGLDLLMLWGHNEGGSLGYAVQGRQRQHRLSRNYCAGLFLSSFIGTYPCVHLLHYSGDSLTLLAWLHAVRAVLWSLQGT